MSTIIRERPGQGARTGAGLKRAIQAWNGHRMVRSQSFMAAIREMVSRGHRMDVIRVALIGDMDSGKSTAAAAIAHAYHSEMMRLHKIPIAVRILNREHLRRFAETLAALRPANYFLIFDDVSFMENKSARKEIAQIKEAVTTIRHMGSSDTRVVLAYNFHYNMALDKFLRMVDYRFWTTVGSEEYNNMERILRNPKHMRLVTAFQRLRDEAVDTGKWSIPVGPGRHTYQYRNPFIPLLYYNNHDQTCLLYTSPSPRD